MASSLSDLSCMRNIIQFLFFVFNGLLLCINELKRIFLGSLLFLSVNFGQLGLILSLKHSQSCALLDHH